jgi:hypothetical protein
MITKTRQKIDELRRRPETARLKTARVLLVSIGIGVAIISLAILLPLQLYLTRPSIKAPFAAEPKDPQVGGLSDRQTEAPSATPGTQGE